ncbi:MAG TPA: neutral zinc metallopeptidase [Terriglobales bacterium]|nr:neutral zinc metallopeptidase [Terriglobales bacterium]
MRWTPGGRSGNLEDQRGGGGFGGGGLKLGIGGTLLLLILSFIFKQDFFAMLDGGQAGSPQEQSRPVNDPQEEPMVQFVSFVLDDTQATWKQVFANNGGQYRDAKLVLFREGVRSACGTAPSAVGPFYCPGDEKVYVDLSFYDELKQRFGAPGDFAQAYVLAHEIGHHVQHLMGTDKKVRQAMENNPGAKNQYSVRMELQADCYAGVWGHATNQRKILEAGDVDEAMNAASSIGDDRLQKMGRGQVSPDSFTHGTSAQRKEWFQRGFESGDVSACNTFQ